MFFNNYLYSVLNTECLTFFQQKVDYMWQTVKLLAECTCKLSLFTLIFSAINTVCDLNEESRKSKQSRQKPKKQSFVQSKDIANRELEGSAPFFEVSKSCFDCKEA